MQELQLLATTLGLSALCGLNLYLTVFATSLSLHEGWLTLQPGLESLQVLDNPIILFLSGFFYLIEFFADKVPWMDSLWDVIHTAVRPIGAAILSLSVLGQQSSVAQIVCVLLAGSLAFGAHLTKAGVRLVANTSPEPFSNIGLSLAEDAVVVGGISALFNHLWITIAVMVLVIGLLIWLAPWGWRQVRATISLFASKLVGTTPPVLQAGLPSAIRERLSAETTDRVLWAVPLFAGRMKNWKSNQRLHLIGMEGESEICLASHQALEKQKISGIELGRHSRFFYEELQIFFPETRRSWNLRFAKNAPLDRILERLKPSSSTVVKTS